MAVSGMWIVAGLLLMSRQERSDGSEKDQSRSETLGFGNGGILSPAAESMDIRMFMSQTG